MTKLRIFFHRLFGLFLRRKLERELEEEIRSHLEMQIEDNLRLGMSPDEARRATRLKFGVVEQVKEAYREKSRLGWIENLWQDLRYSVRMLVKSPNYTLIVALTLSLGIGANTAIFSVVNMLFRPLPVERPDELASVFAERGDPGGRAMHSYRIYIDLRDHNSVFSGLAAHKTAVVAISADERPGEHASERTDVIRGEIVSGNYFDVSAWTVTFSLLTGILFGLAPARHAVSIDLIPTLKNETCAGAVGSRRSSPRNLLVIAQLAISVVVLVCAGLFVKGLYKAQTGDPGFQPENLLSAQLDPGLVGYDAARAKVFFTDLVRQMETLPGVRTASLASAMPFGGTGIRVVNGIVREGDAPPLPGKGLGVGGNLENFAVEINSVGPKYFETMGAPLALGRGFTERDKGKAPELVIISQAAARHFYGNEQQALGKRLRLDESKSPWMEIVGVAQDGHLFEEPRPYLFTPFLQGGDHTRMTMLVRATSANEFSSIAEGVRREARKLDARVPVFQLKLGEDHIRPVLRARRTFAGISTTLAVIAVALAGMGLYGVMAYAVSLRTKEIGIRMALGAQKSDVMGMVLRQGMFLTLIGVAVGVAAAFALTTVVMYLFYGVSGIDPLTFIVIALPLTSVALLACWVPARRATKVDPLIALRYE